MRLYKLENMLLYSMLLNIFVFILMIFKNLMLKMTSQKMNFIDLSDFSKSIESVNIDWLIYVALAIFIINIVAVIVFGLSKDERLTAHKTRKLRQYCNKRLSENAEENKKEIIRYNKIVKTMILDFKDDECVFSFKLHKLEDEKIIINDIDNIIDVVKRIVPNYQFSDYQSCKMVGYKK